MLRIGTALALRALLISAGAVLVTRAAHAQETTAPALVVAGSCPTADAVERALTPLLRRDFVATEGERPKVEDQGNRFLVSVKGQTGQYLDASRDCAERARVSAVFIALTLNPPQIQSTAAAPSAPVPARQGSTRATEPARLVDAKVEPSAVLREWSGLELGARFESALNPDSPSTLAAGLEFRASLGSGHIGGVLGASVLAPVVWELSDVLLREQRFPAHLALRVRWLSMPAAFALDVGVSATAFVVRALEASGESSTTRLDLGPRAAFTAQFETARGLSPYLGVQLEYFPRSYRLLVDPAGEVGTTPHAWFGLSLGASFDLN